MRIRYVTTRYIQSEGEANSIPSTYNLRGTNSKAKARYERIGYSKWNQCDQKKIAKCL